MKAQDFRRKAQVLFAAMIIAIGCRQSDVGIHIARAENVDLGLDTGSISFSTETLYAGDTIRLYARVRNVGDADATAYVLFYQGGLLVGQSQPVSLRANGNPDEVFVDFTVPNGSFNIRAVLQGSSPQDQNPANDSTQTALYSPIVDGDRDGAEDDDDNCVSDANSDQLDTDSDGKGDVCDSDDDGDGVGDSSDAYPLDSSKSLVPVVVPVTTPTTTTTSSTTTSSASTSSASSTQAPSNTPSSPNSGSSGAINGGENAPESESTTTDDQRTTAASSSTSKLTTSPLARFSWKQTDWRTYEFTLAQQPEDGVQFSWDFGDGTTSVQPQITHAFSGPGTFVVTLAIVATDGTTLSDAQTFDITFFHLGNPQVIGLIVLLFIALFAFGFAFIKLRSTYDQDAPHE